MHLEVTLLYFNLEPNLLFFTLSVLTSMYFSFRLNQVLNIYIQKAEHDQQFATSSLRLKYLMLTLLFSF